MVTSHEKTVTVTGIDRCSEIVFEQRTKIPKVTDKSISFKPALGQATCKK